MLPFPPFDPAAIPAEVDAVSGCDNFRGSVPLGLLQSDDVTALCGTGSTVLLRAAMYLAFSPSAASSVGA